MSDYLHLVARVYVNNDGKESVGTCYPIAEDRVITAAHVLQNCDAAEVLWNEHPEWKKLGWQPAAVIWNGSVDGIDLAILQLPVHVEGDTPALLSVRKPEFDERFESRGFPVVGKTPQGTTAVPITGRVIQYLSAESNVTLGADYQAEAAKRTNWRGASGSPLLIEKKLVGVIVSVPGGFEERRIRAVPFCAIADNQGFCDAAGFSVQDQLDADWGENIVNDLTAILENQPSVVTSLLSCLREVKIDTASAQSKVRNVDRAKELAIVISDREEMSAQKLIESLCNCTKLAGDIDNASVCLQIAETLLPWLTSSSMEGEPNLPERDGLISLNVATNAAVEILLASLERRAASFAPFDEDTQNLPAGSKAIPTGVLNPPDIGMHDDAEKRADAAIREIATKQRVVGLPRDAARYEINTVIEVLRDCLQELASEGAPYLAFSKHEDNANEMLRKTAIELKLKVDELRVIQLEGDGDVYLREFRQLKRLRDLLRVRGSTK